MSMAAGRERRSTVSEAEFETAECCERTLRHLTRSFPLLNHPFTRVEVRGMGVRAVALQRIVNVQAPDNRKHTNCHPPTGSHFGTFSNGDAGTTQT